MPAVPLVAAVFGAGAAVYSANQQKGQAKKQADLARRQAAVQQQANVQAAENAVERDRIARDIEEQQKAQTEQLAPDVALAQEDDNPAKRRRTVNAQFNIGGASSDATTTLRL